MPFLTTTIAAETGHNTSASANYSQGVIPANFTGTSVVTVPGATAPVNSTLYDDSFNPVSPGHVSAVSVKTLVPNFTGRWYYHLTPWFHSGGGGGHVDVGVNCNSDAWVDTMIADATRRGFDSLIIDWHGDTNFIDLVTLRIKSRLTVLASTLTFSIMVDPAAYTDTASLETQLAYIETNYLGDAKYESVGGHPLVSFFDRVAGVNYATARASIATTMYWMFENASSLSDSFADACFQWVTAYSNGVDNTDPYKLADVNNFLSTVHSNGKGSMLALYPGFNGTLATWNAHGKYVPRGSAACWLAVAAALNANVPTNCIGIQVVTGNDYEEGTETELGVDNDVRVTARRSANIITFSVSGGSGDESTLSSWKLLATPDGINAAIIGTPGTGSGTHTFDLNSVVGWELPITSYTIYVVAVGKGGIRDRFSVATAGGGGSSGGGSGGGSAPSVFGFNQVTLPFPATIDSNTIPVTTFPNSVGVFWRPAINRIYVIYAYLSSANFALRHNIVNRIDVVGNVPVLVSTSDYTTDSNFNYLNLRAPDEAANVAFRNGTMSSNGIVWYWDVNTEAGPVRYLDAETGATNTIDVVDSNAITLLGSMAAFTSGGTEFVGGMTVVFPTGALGLVLINPNAKTLISVTVLPGIPNISWFITQPIFDNDQFMYLVTYDATSATTQLGWSIWKFAIGADASITFVGGAGFASSTVVGALLDTQRNRLLCFNAAGGLEVIDASTFATISTLAAGTFTTPSEFTTSPLYTLSTELCLSAQGYLVDITNGFFFGPTPVGEVDTVDAKYVGLKVLNAGSLTVIGNFYPELQWTISSSTPKNTFAVGKSAFRHVPFLNALLWGPTGINTPQDDTFYELLWGLRIRGNRPRIFVSS